jgi:hypothetical protein
MCNAPDERDDDPSTFCKCRAAVHQTYAALTAYNNPENLALEAAIRVYRFHHPEAPRMSARLTVENWLNANHRH